MATTKSRRVFRIGVYALTSLIGVFGVTAVALRVYVTRIEQKGADLQSRVLALKPGVSTLEDVRRLAEQTQLPTSYDGRGKPCSDIECSVGLGPMTLWLWKQNQTLAWPFSIVGIRPTNYNAQIYVIDGYVRSVRFNVFQRSRPAHFVFSSVVLIQRFSRDDLRFSSDGKHATCGGLWQGETGSVIDHLMVGIATESKAPPLPLELSCVTSVRGCRTASELVSRQFPGVDSLDPAESRRECKRIDESVSAWYGAWVKGQPWVE